MDGLHCLLTSHGPDHMPVPFSGVHISELVSADDVVLMTASPIGRQLLIDPLLFLL